MGERRPLRVLPQQGLWEELRRHRPDRRFSRKASLLRLRRGLSSTVSRRSAPNCTLPKRRRSVKRGRLVEAAVRAGAREDCYNFCFMARQRLGQHFLRAGWPEQIARAICVSRHSLNGPEKQNFCWIEIGAGHGEMTEHLASTGAPVYA